MKTWNPQDVGGWKLQICPRVWGNRWPHWCINYTLICFFSSINACSLRILSYKLVNFDMQIKVEEKALLWSRLYEKYFSWSFHILSANRRHLLTCSKIEFHELYYFSRCALDKICEIYTFDRCPHGCTGQKSFLACSDAKKGNWRTTKLFLKHVS